MLLCTLALALPMPLQDNDEPQTPEVGTQEIRAAGAVIGLELSEEELELMVGEVLQNMQSYAAMQTWSLDNAVVPAVAFHALMPGVSAHPWSPPEAELELPAASRPDDLEELAFASIPTLAALVRSREVSCVELAELFLDRLERMDAELHCVVELCRERALEQARALDAELERGEWRGPLHGIPWGAKDLLAVRGTRTTWGAKPFEEQVIDVDATVVERLDAAGAVLVAKLSLGALAMGDVWFGGRTRNPWDTRQGSSGSSAGSASATAAGCVPFAIGSETLGSIVSPSDRCGTTGLRPTYGRVSRRGAMALSWSMDKLGPLCRSAEDAALVYAAIAGVDARDAHTVDLPVRIPHRAEVAGWRVGILAEAFEESERTAHVLGELEALGVELVPIELPDYPVWPMMIILQAEAAAAFDELTRSGDDDLLTRQDRSAWPNSFRASRLIPAVEYIRANRLRSLLCADVHAALEDVDVLVHPSFGGSALGITNLTGHPSIAMPCGFRGEEERGAGTPYSVTFTGKLYDEARLLALAQAWQASTDYHLRHPAQGEEADER